MGVHIGDQLVGPKKGNPRGHFEAVPILEFHESLLSRFLQDKLTTFDKGIFVPEPLSCAYSEEDKQAARQLIESLQRDGVWGWKEPRTCLFLDLWREILPDVRAVIVYRHPLEVHQSLLRRGHWGLALFHGLAMDTYATFNHALLEWQSNDNYFFNASAGFAQMNRLCTDLQFRFQLPQIPEQYAFHGEEFNRMEISPSLHRLTGLLFPDAVAAFDQLQERAEIPYTFVERRDDSVFEALYATLSPYLKEAKPEEKAHFLPVLDAILRTPQEDSVPIYTQLATAICREYDDLGNQYKSLGEEFVEQQAFLREQTITTEKAWDDYEDLNKRHEALGTDFSKQQAFLEEQSRENKKLWSDFQSLGKLYADQQAYLKDQSEKYGKIWDDHLRLKKAHEWISDQFRAQQERFARQTDELKNLYESHKQLGQNYRILGEQFKEQQIAFINETLEKKALWEDYQRLGLDYAEKQRFLQQQAATQQNIWDQLKNLQGEHQRLGSAFSSQQQFLHHQTEKLGTVWSDYAQLQDKHQVLGKEFKKQQINMARLWEDYQRLGLDCAEKQRFLQQQAPTQQNIWNQLKNLQEEHQRLGSAFSSQQQFLQHQTEKLGTVWSDYAQLQDKHQRLGKEFKKQQINMARLWEDGGKMWKELQQLKKQVKGNSETNREADGRSHESNKSQEAKRPQ
jgi:hypothetical protein